MLRAPATIEEINVTFNKNYERLYDGEYPESIQRCLCDRGDELLKERKDVAKALMNKRQDLLTSDREVAAFALTLYDLWLA